MLELLDGGGGMVKGEDVVVFACSCDNIGIDGFRLVVGKLGLLLCCALWLAPKPDELQVGVLGACIDWNDAPIEFCNLDVGLSAGNAAIFMSGVIERELEPPGFPVAAARLGLEVGAGVFWEDQEKVGTLLRSGVFLGAGVECVSHPPKESPMALALLSLPRTSRSKSEVPF